MKINLSDHFNFSKLFRFTLPSIVMMVFTSIYGVVDGFFVSNFVGKTPFAAVNFIMPFLMILGTFGFMFGTGGSALIAKTMGEGDSHKAQRLFSFFVYSSAACGVVLGVLGFLFIRPVAAWLGAEGEMLELCGLKESQMPTFYESSAPIGTLLPETARALGLPEKLTVCAGAGDNAAAAVGTGTVGAGKCNISLGTSGTVFIPAEKFGVDESNSLHAFAHADGKWHLMGCMLSAASCNKWWEEDILGTADYAGEQAAITPDMLGRNPVYFLPYLMGERSPINDTRARGAFLGMGMDTSRASMTLAVLEGVAFAIRDSFEVAKGLGLPISRSTICGGGSKSALWREILANVLGIPLDIVATEQGPGYGGALLSMVACGQFASVEDACQKLVQVRDTVQPVPSLTALYEERYQQFRAIYPACKDLFPKLQ